MKPQLIFVIVFLATCSGSYGVNGSQKIREECLKPMHIGPCQTKKLERYYFDAAEGKCKQFIFGGCNPNTNNFESVEKCEEYCLTSPEKVCQELPANGKCRASMSRYFYNATEKKCNEFSYVGCGANNNNFRTEKGCQDFCANV